MARNEKFTQREEKYTRKIESMAENAKERIKWIEEFSKEIDKKKAEEEAEYDDTGETGNPDASTGGDAGASTGGGDFQFQGGAGFTGVNIAAAAQKIMNEHKSAPYSQAVRDIIGKNTGDCSTLTRQAIQMAGGPNIGGYTGEQIANQAGQLIIPREQLLPGDCIFFKSTDGSGHRVNVPGVGSFNVVHCAIAMGGDKFIDMASGKGEWGGLGLRSLNTNWYGARYVCARRFAPPGGSGSSSSSTPKKEEKAQAASLQFFADTKELIIPLAEGEVTMELPLPQIIGRSIVLPKGIKRAEMLAYWRRDFINQPRLMRLPDNRYQAAVSSCTMLVHPSMKVCLDLIYEEMLRKGMLKRNKLHLLQTFDPKSKAVYKIGLAVKIQTGYNKEETYAVADMLYLLGFENIKPGDGFVHVDIFPSDQSSYVGHGVYAGPNSWR